MAVRLTGSESEEQQALFQWATLMTGRYPELELLYHVPNGGARNPATAGRLKAEGVKAGVPDVCLPVPRGIYHGLYIEMKVKPNRPTKDQLHWLELLSRQGHKTAVCYSWKEASALLEKYLALQSGEILE